MPLLYPTLIDAVPPDWSHQTNIRPKKNVFGLIGPFVWPFDASGWPPMTHKTVAKHHPGCALACSITLIPNCFTIL